MTGAGLLLLALTSVVAFADWIAVDQHRRRIEYVCKPLTIVLLIAAVLAFDVDDGTMRVWFVTALALSLVGDAFLMSPRDLFVPGLAAFLGAHVAYIVGLWSGGIDPVPLVVGILGAAALLATVGQRVLSGVRVAEPPLVGPVVAYMGVIAAMAASAFGTGNLLAAVGASLFVTSDAMIAWNRFIETKPWRPVAIIVTYHLGQVGLALSLL